MSDDPTPPSADARRAAAQAKVEKWKKMVEQHPDHELFRYSLATALFDAGDFAAAEPHFGRALAQKPDWVVAAIFRAKCLLQLRRIPEAKALLAEGRRHSIAQGHDAPVEEIDALLEMLP